MRLGAFSSSSHFMQVLFMRQATNSRRNFRTGAAWLCALLVLARPDHAILCAPIALYLAIDILRRRTRRRLVGFISAIVPVVAWYGFATIYYGTPVPNTAYAKVAFPLNVTWPHGLAYAWDYGRHEPLHALLIIAVVAFGLATSIRRLRARQAGAGMILCLTLGVVAQAVYVISIGGDFMRGRFWLPTLVASAVLGVHLLAHLLPLRDLSRPVTLALAAAGVLLCFVQTPTLRILHCVGLGLDDLQYHVLSREAATIGTILVLAAITLAAAVRLRRLGGSRKDAVFLVLVPLYAVLLTGLMGYRQPPWSVIAIFGATLICSAYACSLVIAGRSLQGWTVTSLFALLIAMTGSLCDVSRPRESSTGTIDDVYSFYHIPGWHNPFRFPIDALRGTMADWKRVGDAARRYAEAQGPITVAYDSLGITSYYSGPAVRVIDLYGLADPFIARSGTPPLRKIGHTHYEVPTGYLQSRAVLNLVPNWFHRLKSLDPTLIADARTLQKNAQWPDEKAHRRWMETRLVISGDLFSIERLRTTYRYMFPERRRIPSWPTGQAPRDSLAPDLN